MLQYKFLNRRGDAVVIVGRRDIRRDGLHFVDSIGHGHGETGGFEKFYFAKASTASLNAP